MINNLKVKKLPIIFLSIFMISVVAVYGQQKKKTSANKATKDLSKFSKATFASGCFWCVEAVFESVIGVEEAESGYAGGKESNPTYEMVSAHATGHAEAVQVYYDQTVVSYATLLKVYFASQNPTQVNGQGPDKGAPYRSMIFYRNDDEKTQAQKYIAELQKNYKSPITAQLAPLNKFWIAEEYHQDYVKRNPQVGYVQGESIPRIKRFQKQHPELIKPTHKL
jgi:peptide-methionine (S)-S-oxide reductase